MPYDEVIASRIRDLLADDPTVTEKKMFGGLAFLVGGHMAIAASSAGGALVRVDPARLDRLVATTAKFRWSCRVAPWPDGSPFPRPSS